jgi:hypothetical protein
MSYRYKYIFHGLRPLGYKLDFHPLFAVRMVNKYGLLNDPVDEASKSQFLKDPERISNLFKTVICKDELLDINVLLTSLVLLASDDEKPLFIW